MTAEELDELKLEGKVEYAIWVLEQTDDKATEIVKELWTRYKTVKILANNYKKALEALDHASKQ